MNMHMETPGKPCSSHRLVCLPHAGGSAHVFAALQQCLPASIELVALDYPGHGRRAAEPLCYSAEEIARDLLSSSLFKPSGAFSLFGHSMGALIAWIMARMCCAQGQPPRHLFLSARQPPCAPRLHPDLAECSDGDFVRGMDLYGGLPREITRDTSALEFFLPILRADFAAVEKWQAPCSLTPLPVPISAIYGKADPSIPSGSMEAWSAYSSAGFCRVGFEGGHFHLFENPEPICRHIVKILDAG